MADQYIAVAPDSTGKKLQTYENTISGNVVQAEAVALVNTSGAAITTLPVSIAATVVTKETRAATPAQSSVANSVTSVTLLSANANRLGATIYNDSASGGAKLSVKLGATASGTSFTVTIAPQGYYEIPFNYTGIIDGIATAATGSARITELT